MRSYCAKCGGEADHVVREQAVCGDCRYGDTAFWRARATALEAALIELRKDLEFHGVRLTPRQRALCLFALTKELTEGEE
ncbi:MAG: hypothetical protein JSV86_16815 [Gemmatimonadota bacterium]|nr:MAG: hypothetical protein JSV86_16815 [Gemmatimonadota bacterium]